MQLYTPRCTHHTHSEMRKTGNRKQVVDAERERMHSGRSGVIRRAACADGTHPHFSNTSVTGSHREVGEVSVEGLKERT